MNNLLHLVGIAKKAGRLEVGEEPVGSSARARQAKLILVACDAADNSARRAAHFAEAGKIPWMQTPFTKAELGMAVGRSACAMMALTDIGFAAALAEKLAVENKEYAPASVELTEKAAKAVLRQKEKRVHERRMREGQKRPWAAPPKDGKPAGKKAVKAPSAKSGPAPARPAATQFAAVKRSMPRGMITISKKAP